MARTSVKAIQEFRSAIGDNIRYLRLYGKSPCTQLELAIQAGERPESISRIERGKVDFGISHLLKIANALDVDPMRLLDRQLIEHGAAPHPDGHARRLPYGDNPGLAADHIHDTRKSYDDDSQPPQK